MTLNITSISRALRYSRTLSHLRHYHGYGIHSPFVYALERNVFIKRYFISDDTCLFELLRNSNVGCRRAMQIQNMFHYCAYNEYFVDHLDECPIKEDCMYIATKESTVEQLERFVAKIGNVKLTMCMMFPRYNKERNMLCRKLIKNHNGMSIDNIGFVLYLYNDKKRKQHIIL